VRGVIVDGENRVLLAKWARPSDGARFWLCPGGAVEDGETDAQALAREVAEETGLTGAVAGAHVATWFWSNGYQHRFYIVRCENFVASTGPGHPDYEVFDEYRWWGADELDECPDLGPEPHARALLQAILRGQPPAQPLEWRVDPPAASSLPLE
jgi:8-oxo-dGTP pyrophosphatase MutT (NUDIX family)